MKAGKVSEAVLKRSVIEPVNRQLKQFSTSIAGVGSDAGLFAVEDREAVLAQASTMLAGNSVGMAELAVFRVCNSLAAAGGTPLAVSVQLMLPETMEEAGLKQTMQEVLSACERAGVAVSSGHTQVSTLVTERVIAVTATGTASGVRQLNETAAGSELFMIGTAGLAGTALLAGQYRESLHERYTGSFIDKAADCRTRLLTADAAKALRELGVVHMHDVAEGGVFGAIWELARRLSCGVEIAIKKIPILQETVEISEYFDINPYQLRGDGALLFLAHDGAAVTERLKELGFSAAFIGRMTDGNDRIVVNEEEIRHLEPNRVEEYERAVQVMREKVNA